MLMNTLYCETQDAQKYQICLCMRVWFTFAAHLVTAVTTIIDSITSLLQRHTLAIYTFEATRCVCKYRKIKSQFWRTVGKNIEVLTMYPFIVEGLVHSGSPLSLANHRYVARCGCGLGHCGLKSASLINSWARLGSVMDPG